MRGHYWAPMRGHYWAPMRGTLPHLWWDTI